ncbi:MAG: TRAP transporter small permease [Alphaproteobacteria bacterium]|nr:TRAP transporter small permease [Alphaproteobacteria bacterium]
MAALCIITFANVVVRYLTDRSFAFTEEYSVVLMVVLALFGTASAFAGDRHIRLTFLIERLRKPVQRRIEYAVAALCLIMFGLLVVLGARLAWDEYRFEVTTSGLGHPQWLFTLVLPVLSVVVVLRIAGRLVRVWRARAQD